jgi:hypothetical protein
MMSYHVLTLTAPKSQFAESHFPVITEPTKYARSKASIIRNTSPR